MKKPTNKLYLRAFTLVELIVVIVILAILATIAFLSFNSYSSSARDSTRLADVNSLNKGIELYQINSGYYPTPEGTISTGTIMGVNITYKGIIGDQISEIVNINKTPKDPLSTSNYVYGISYDKKYFQIGVVLESGANKTGYNNGDNNSIDPFDSAQGDHESVIARNEAIQGNIFDLENVFNNLLDPSTALRMTNYDDAIGINNNYNNIIQQVNAASGAGNYFSKIKGNYNGVIKFSSGTSTKTYYLANIPSLLYNDINPNLLNTGTYYIVNNGTNLPYQIDSSTTTNNKTADLVIKDTTNKSTATLTGVDITAIVNATGSDSRTSLINSTFSGTTLDSFGGDINVISSVVNGAGTSGGSGSTAVINGVCGTNNGLTLAASPTTNLCTTGTGSSVLYNTGAGTYNWSCQAGTTVSCKAYDNLNALLMHFEGNLDNSGSNIGIVANNGGVSFTGGKFGSGISFNGSSNYLSAPNSADWNFGSSNFTIDTYVYFNDIGGVGQEVIASCYTNSTNWLFQLNNGKWSFYDGTYHDALVGPLANTWYHFAVVRVGNSITLYVNGESVLTYSNTNNITAGNYLIFGAHAYSIGSPQLFMKGYIDEFRISKGVARWTAPFTAPTSPY